MQIKSLKHDGSLHRLWHENTLLQSDELGLIGMNQNTPVTEANGEAWHTRGLAVFYFPLGKWFNVILLYQEEDYSFYCNIASPYQLVNGILRYIDYEIDIIVQSDYSYELVDQAEFEEHAEKWQYDKGIKENVSQAMKEVEELIQQRQAPFNEEFVRYWYDRCNQ